MKNKKIDINSIGFTTLILFVICFVIAGLLAGTNAITKNRIESLKEKNKEDSLSVVLKADEYEKNKAEFLNSKGEKISADYYEAKSGEDISGYIFTTSAKGYGGIINVMTGITKDGVISNVKILSAEEETAGLGANVKNKAFYSQYSGKENGVSLVKNNATDKNQVVAVTGATISSTAVHKCVNEAYEIYSSLLPDTEENEESKEIKTGEEEAENE